SWYFSSVASIEYRVRTRTNAAHLRAAHCEPPAACAADFIAAASAQGFAGGTTHPVSPIISLASPTSVLIQGTPSAMASTNTFGNASLTDERMSASERRKADRT